MTGTTTADLLLARVGDPHPALRFEDETYSWDEVVAAGAARARMIVELRRPGPFHVGVLLDNVPEYLFWITGAALVGAAVVGINPTRRGAELAADIRHTDCQLIVTDRAQAAVLEGLDLGLVSDRMLCVDEPRYGQLVSAHAGAAAPDVAVSAADTLLLLFTSGSTGAPKAVVCTQGRFARIAGRTPGQFGIARDTVTYECMPLFHGNALMANWAPVLGVGATMAMRRRFSASGFLPDVRRYGASFFNYVGRALAYVLATPAAADDADNPLRLGFGTEASARDMELFAARFGCGLMESYGSSEGAISIEKAPGTPPNALGLPIHGSDVAIIDPSTGIECPRARFDADGALVNGHGAIGEIVGRNVAANFEGYYNNPGAEAERLRGGWYWTGDLGYRDEDGWFYFAGRGADWLRVDSENFATAPIERIMFRFPGVVMAAAYPVPDPRTGDQVMVAFELEPGIEFDPAAFEVFLSRQPDLGTKWAPRFVRVVRAMPLTASNKVQKAPLRSERWETSDPVYWRPGESGYRRLTPADVERLGAEFIRHGRAGVLAAS
ncbi:MAG: AMP-binding protein [Acidimicrobiales bacterium]